MKTIRVNWKCGPKSGTFVFDWDNENDDNDENALDGIIPEMIPRHLSYEFDYSWSYTKESPQSAATDYGLSDKPAIRQST